MSKQNKSDEMSPEELQALSLPILGTYEEDETFALKPEEQAKEFPLIALRNMSILPGTVVPILVGRRKSMQVIRQSEIRERCSVSSPSVTPMSRIPSSATSSR